MTSVARALFGDHRDPVQELTGIFADEPVQQAVAVDRVIEWGRRVLADAGVPAEKQVSAIAALRTAEPRLGLKTATYLNGLLRQAGHAGDGVH